MLGAGQYMLRMHVGHHKALIVIDGVEDECKLVRCAWAHVSADSMHSCSRAWPYQKRPSQRDACASARA